MRSTHIQTAALMLSSVLALPTWAMSDVPPQTLETRVLVTNSTLQPMTVSSSHGTLLSDQIPALATRELSVLLRDEDSQSEQRITLSAGDFTVQLSQQLQGTELSYSASGNQWQLPQLSGEQTHRQLVELGQFDAQVAVKGQQLQDGGQLHYVIQTQDEKPKLADAGSFNVLSYNVWATTIYGSKKVGTRLGLMPEVMAGYDVLVLTEVFDPIASNTLLDALRAEYPYQTSEIFKLGKVMGSGTRVLSRWPFELEAAHKYQACDGLQCAATRGVIYAKINKLGKPYHVFATHTQSSDDDANRNARKAQLLEMGEYIRSLNIPANEAVVMAGDFNVNKGGLPEDRDYMEAVLNAMEPQNTGHDQTYDANTNFWAEQPYVEYLDYTLVSRAHQTPISAEQNAFAPRSTNDELWGEWDLSDHYPVRGLFQFDASQTERQPFPYFGEPLHLQTSNGHYVRAMSGGDSFISAGSDHIGTWETFVLEPVTENKVALRARGGQYVGLDSYVFGTLKAKFDSPEVAAQFELVTQSNNAIALKADNGKFVRADFGGGVGLSANARAAKEYETFVLMRP
ncbi:endonuclease/exonuclease/phosphatase family protein [Bacterioplanes sanyensis]|uniref:DUF7910 domain-containing protein n=1 Tax=Bacterioplanes sanyensis TaxID=1249553 RepID=UPI0018EEA1C2|nr:endonuclease/exonuclease/phosphatase family protein [Bacterioplanes sanyensis]